MSLFRNIHTIRFDTIDSTHIWSKKNISTFERQAFTCVTSVEQTAGIGRHQRSWLSPKGFNIHATFCFFLSAHSPSIANLGQLLSLSAASVLENYGFKAEIKWPNDLRVAGKKIAGILCDTITCSDQIGIVLSIGLNVNMTDDQLKSIGQPATSFAQLSGKTWDLDAILHSILQQFLTDLTILQERGFTFFKERYEEMLAFKNEKIRCFDGITTREGICHAISSDGRLELILPNGKTLYLSAGELYHS